MEHTNTDFSEVDMKPFSLDQPASHIDHSILTNTLRKYDENNLFHFLKRYVGEQRTSELMSIFRVGTTTHWSGASILWQISNQDEIRSGKIILFDPITGKPSQHPDHRPVQVHRYLKLERYVMRNCLFGEHQLTSRPKDTVAIVASEVAAIVGTAFFPAYVWLASEGTNNLELYQCQALARRSLILFPSLSIDGKAFKRWNRTAKDFTKLLNCQVNVSSYLEDNASETERSAGLDIGDFLVRECNVEEKPFSKGDDSSLVQQDDTVSATASNVQPLHSVTAS